MFENNLGQGMDVLWFRSGASSSHKSFCRCRPRKEETLSSRRSSDRKHFREMTRETQDKRRGRKRIRGHNDVVMKDKKRVDCNAGLVLPDCESCCGTSFDCVNKERPWEPKSSSLFHTVSCRVVMCDRQEWNPIATRATSYISSRLSRVDQARSDQ